MKPYFDDGQIQIYHGDCALIAPALGRFDLLCTDPPYGIGIASNPVRQAHAKMAWDASAPDPILLSTLIDSCSQAIIWGGNYFGLPPHQCFLVWDKQQPEDFSLAMAEVAWTNLDGPAKLFRKSVTSYRKTHPTQKPVELMTWCLSKAKAPSTVIDPFMGSGTTLRACKDLGIRAVGIEREERYCEIAVRRLSQQTLFSTAQ